MLMKDKIHPEYKEVQFTCNCGNSFVTRSTSPKKQMIIEICSNCHPFYTGLQKLVDTGGRVDKFKQKYTQKPEAEKVVVSEVKAEAKAKKKEKVKAVKAKVKTSRKIKIVTKPKEKKAAAPKAAAHPKTSKTSHKPAAKKTTAKKK